MESEWPTERLGNLLEITSSKRIFRTDYCESGVPFYRGKEIVELSKGNRISTELFISTEKFEEIKNKCGAPDPGDLLLTSVGTLGAAYLVQKGDCFYFKDGNLTWFRNFSDRLLPRFLLLWFRSSIAKRAIDEITIGSTQQALTIVSLKTLQLSLPPLSVQKTIAHILGTLDDKIELNRQMNSTLEAMAQALFKSWFVDFDPVIDNALAAGNPIPEPLQARAEARAALGDQRKPLPEAIRSQFPNRFVFREEMGWVPEGWDDGVFGNIATHVKDNVKADEVGDYDFYVGLEHIGRKALFLSDNATGDSIESNKSRFTENDLLFGKLRPYFHKVCIAPQDGICSTDILVFRAKLPSWHSYMVLTACREEFVEYANLRSTGTRMPRASAKDMLNYPISAPPNELAETFESEVSAFWGRGIQNVEQSRDLAKLRDTLLPKLLSGQLRIPDAEKQLAEAL